MVKFVINQIQPEFKYLQKLILMFRDLGMESVIDF